MKKLGAGIRQTVSFKNLKKVDIIRPPVTQQTTIANFLDTETSKIDLKVSTLEKKLNLLEKYKQSLIYEAVTKGLDSNAPMKDSGIEWVGEIPANWEVRRLKDVVSNLGGGNYGEDEGSEGYLMPCISISDFKNSTLDSTSNVKIKRVFKNKNILKKGSILIAKSCAVGKSIYLVNDLDAYYTNFVQGLKIIGPVPKFISYILQIVCENKLHMTFVKQITLPNFDFNKFASHFQIPIPNLKTQNAIVNHLDTETSKIDLKVSILKQKIMLLKEYKQSLIYEAVTGKMALN